MKPEEIINSFTPEQKNEFERLEKIARSEVGEVECGVSYGVLAIMYHQKPLLGMAIYKNHLSLFPYSGKVVSLVKDKLSEYATTSGSIHFSLEKPVPKETIALLIKYRAKEIEDRAN